jgi:hypothetical protein
MAQGIVDCHRRLDACGGAAAAISRRCREFVENRYSWDRNVAALESILLGVRQPMPGLRGVWRAGEVGR